MSDDTIYPDTMYPGGSEADFRKLKLALAERDALLRRIMEIKRMPEWVYESIERLIGRGK